MKSVLCGLAAEADTIGAQFGLTSARRDITAQDTSE